MSSTDRAWLIDASIYIFRAWFSMPDNWHTTAGQPVSAVYGYTRFLLDFLEQSAMPVYCAAAFDESLRSNYRNDIYPDYKASRELPDENLAFQLNACRKITVHLGIPTYGGPRYEADDYLASLARLCRQKSIPVTVVTRDKDLGQLIVAENDNWWDFAQGELIDAAAFETRFGVRPDQFADYLALVGDPVDDIPGVPGVGAKTAARLLQEYDDLDGLAKGLGAVHNLSLRGAAGIAKKLQHNWAQALLARQLTALEEKIPEVDTLPTFRLSADALKATEAYLKELNIGGPLVARCQALARTLAP
jgi:5'-3' exonuclease